VGETVAAGDAVNVGGGPDIDFRRTEPPAISSVKRFTALEREESTSIGIVPK